MNIKSVSERQTTFLCYILLVNFKSLWGISSKPLRRFHGHIMVLVCS